MDGKFRLKTTASQFESKTIAHAINCFVFCGFSADTNVKVIFPSKKTNQSQLSFQKKSSLGFLNVCCNSSFRSKIPNQIYFKMCKTAGWFVQGAQNEVIF